MKRKVATDIPQGVVLKAIEVYKRPGMVWQNVPATLKEEFGLVDESGDLYHNHGLCAAANKISTYSPKRKKSGFMGKAKKKALSAALLELGITATTIDELIDKASSKLNK